MWPFGKRNKPADSSEPDRERDPVIVVRTYPNEPLAQLAIEVLRDEGIKAFARPNGPGFGAWGSVATFPHDLFVLESSQVEATAILRDLDSPASFEE